MCVDSRDKVGFGSWTDLSIQNIYAETTFVCPSYWMAIAYNDVGRTSYKYQFSVEPALHGGDVSGCA